MKIEIIKTEDGSTTVKNEFFDQTYHSTYGAISESRYVYIENGLLLSKRNNLNIFEVGFGTGLNAALTLLEAQKRQLIVNYFSIEKYPIDFEDTINLNFEPQIKNALQQINSAEWNKTIEIAPNFILHKIYGDFCQYIFDQSYDLVYYDAFSYDVCPELWTEACFQKIFDALNNGGILVTYSSKGIVKNNLRNSGFKVKRLPGFRKHHMIVASKP